MPNDHVVGKAVFVWLSLDKNKGWFSGKIRWKKNVCVPFSMINIMGKISFNINSSAIAFSFSGSCTEKPFTGKVTYKIDLNMAGLPEEVRDDA